MKEVVVKFVDFWKGFDETNNFFLDALSPKYKVTVIPQDSPSTPQILFYSIFGKKHLYYNCVKVFFTGENDVPDFNECDYGISFHNISFGNRHLRYPLYVTYPEYGMVKELKEIDSQEALNRDFCSMVISNMNTADPIRASFIDKISSYKPIASGGKYQNNTGGPVADKWNFVRNYKFNLAFENSNLDNYTTEKIVDAFSAYTVPIYWGNRFVGEEFNPHAFINVSDYDSTENLIKTIAEIDSNPELYLKMLKAPKFNNEGPLDWEDQFSSFLDHIVENPCKKTPNYGYTKNIQYEAKLSNALIDKKIFRGIAKLLNK